MDAAINLIVWVMIFALAGWAMYATCIKFELPKPVLWICGGILLIGILVFLGRVVDGGLPMPFYHGHH